MPIEIVFLRKTPACVNMWRFPEMRDPQIIHVHGIFLITHPLWGTPLLGNLHVVTSSHETSEMFLDRVRFFWIRQGGDPNHWQRAPDLVGGD